LLETRMLSLVSAGSRASEVAEIEAVVQTKLDGLLFVADAWIERAEISEVTVAKIIVLVFDFSRPAWGEHVFQTAAHGVTIASAVAGGIEAIRNTGVRPSITAFGVQ
jgi:hypothetical protein